MFGSKKKSLLNDLLGQMQAINRSQAVIEFDLNGNILKANENFLKTVGYSLAEIQGRHHSMFVDGTYKNSPEYDNFWAGLRRGEFSSGEYKRYAKGGKEVWIQASYNPILDETGKPYKVVKYATDVTAQKVLNADYAGQIDAIGKSQAVIEFNMDGTITNANHNFLKALGYSLEEIKGRHHSIFVDPAFRDSQEYQNFWEGLRSGRYNAGEFCRFGKGGKEVWIQASYNPILDLNGKPFKVVKYASDITSMVMTRIENERGMKECIDVLKELSEGNFTRKMDLEYKGTFADIKRALNETITILNQTINECVDVLGMVSQGNLKQKMQGNYKGSFSKISEAVNVTIDRLCSMVTRISASSQTVKNAANEIATGSSDLSTRTEQQASSLEETSASMEEITGTTRTNSANAVHAQELSSNASNVAEQGGRVVEDAVNAMSNIEKSSQKISDIISVIDEIAFQTNLLALNAAVEAARAGDAGKGFAVVASEVRSLAGRSATASKEIKTLINESASQVKHGAELVNNAGRTLKEIVSSVKQVAGIVADISSASQQQATGISEVNTAVAQMDEMTQQNAALVEENTAAAHSMVEQARSLEELISFFSIPGAAGSQSAAFEKLHEVAQSSSQIRATHAAVRDTHSPHRTNGHSNGHDRHASTNSVKAYAKTSQHEKGWEEF